MQEVHIHVHIHHRGGELEQIKEILMGQNEQIEQFRNDVNAALTQVGESLTNIAADEAALLQRIEALASQAAELTPENADKLQGILTSVKAMAARSSDIAASIPDLVPTPEPPPLPPAA